MKELINQLKNLAESSIDFPKKTLCPAIWKKEGDSYSLLLEVKKIIFKTLQKYTIIDILNIADTIHITGSIGTTQYLEDTDIDVHVVVDENKLDWPEKVQKDVFKFFREEENVVYIEKHPIEVFIQYNPKQELLSEAVYNLIKDTWIIGPKVTDQNYNPYEDFSDVLKDVKELAGEADVQLGELKRDTIDYGVISKALESLDAEAKKKLVVHLKDKLKQIEDDIENLKELKGSWIKMRRDSSKPATEEEALKDVELAEQWKDANAKFKFLSRYKYMKTISKLETMLEDSKIDSQELNTIKQMMGVERD